MTADSSSYVDPADALRNEHRFWSEDPVAQSVPEHTFAVQPRGPDTFRTPAYPAFLAVVQYAGGTLLTVILLQHLFVLLGSAALYLIGTALYCETAGAVSALFFGLHPAVVQSSNQIMSETVCAMMVGLALLLLCVACQRRSMLLMALCGLSFGIATLTRPICQYLPIVLLVWLLTERRRFRLAAVFALASTLLPAAWIFRNYHVAHVATISSGAGEVLLLYHAAGTLVVANEPALHAIFALQRQSGFYRPALKLRALLVRAALTHNGQFRLEANHAQRARLYGRAAVKILGEHPVAYAGILTSAVIALLFDDLSYIAASHGYGVTSARLLLVPVSAGLFVLATIGCRSLIRSDQRIGWPLTIGIVYFIVLSAFPEVEPRFFVPFAPLYAVAVGIGVTSALLLKKNRSATAEQRRAADHSP
jgi:4-amino-4-deoxy-L-arabinose transferase-like glycosyltransferase